jgi:hypothetical protein
VGVVGGMAESLNVLEFEKTNKRLEDAILIKKLVLKE